MQNCARRERVRQAGRRESLFLEVNQWISMQLIWDIKRCSQIMHSLERTYKCAAALLNRGMTDVKRQSSVFQAMLRLVCLMIKVKLI
jgi:hypothetical protein